MPSSSPLGTTLLKAGQWTLFMLANLVVIPVVVGYAYHLGPAGTSQFLQRTLVLTGILSGFQVLLGHRLPLIEGPSGLWLSVFLALASESPTPAAAHATLGALRVGLLAAGGLLTVFSLLGWVERIAAIFTPAVTGVYLILLSLQLGNEFLPGMLLHQGHLALAQTALGLALMGLVMWVSLAGPAPLRPFALLAGLAAGWLAYLALGLGPSPHWSRLPLVWPFASGWGYQWNLGILILCLLTGLINLTNTIASLQAYQAACEFLDAPAKPAPHLADRASLGTALGNLVAGIGSAVGMITFSISAGYIQISRDLSRLTFLLASLALIGLGLWPALTQVMASLPLPVGDAVLLVTYVQMLGMGLAALGRAQLTPRNVYRVGLPLVVGVGLMTLPASAYGAVPEAVRTIVSNGLLIGVLLVLGLERLPWPDRAAPASRLETTSPRSSMIKGK